MKAKAAARPKRLRGFFELPESMRNELLPWIRAVMAFEHGDPRPLGLCVGGAAPIPDEIRNFLADVISGKRRQGPPVPETSVPAAKRLEVAALVAAHGELLEWIRDGARYIKHEPPGLANLAEHLGRDTLEVKRDFQRQAHEGKEFMAKEHGVSVETIENIVREYRDLINRWPDV